MKISKQARRTAKDVLVWVTENGQLNPARIHEAVKRLAEEKPRGYLAILTHFQRLVKLELDRRTALVDSAVALTPATETQIKEKLARIYGQGLTVQFNQVPQLLGGLRIKVGSDVYDGSIQARLNKLQENFSSV